MTVVLTPRMVPILTLDLALGRDPDCGLLLDCHPGQPEP